MGLMRAINRMFGLFCVLLAGLFALFALLEYQDGYASSSNVLAGILGAIALLLTLIGRRALRNGRTGKSLSRSRRERSHTGLKYEDFTWGEPAPSRRQFGYAMSLGADVRHGMTRWMISDAIDEAIERQRSDEPATKEQLRIIREYHGVLPRSITRGEANDAIEFLEEYSLRCPFCRAEIFATDDMCCSCNRSLRRMKIPVKL